MKFNISKIMVAHKQNDDQATYILVVALLELAHSMDHDKGRRDRLVSCFGSANLEECLKKFQ